MDHHRTRTRRQLIGSALGLAGACACAGAASALSSPSRPLTLGGAVDAPARALARAEPVGVRGLLDFPVDASGGDLVIPNPYRAGGHNGIDIGNGCTDGRGRALLACADGVVHGMYSLSRAGRLIILRDAEDNYYRYHHLDGYVDGMAEGDRVRRGDVVGHMGTTGNTQWPHLHFEVWRNSLNPDVDGFHVDPLPLLTIPRGVVVGSTTC